MIRQTKEGFWIIDGDSHIGKWVEDEGRLDHDYSLQKVLKLIPVGGVVIDGGANIGTHSWSYLRRVGNDGTVISYEPNQEAFECLKRNCPKAFWYNLGLSDRAGIFWLEVPGDNKGASQTRHMPPANDTICMINCVRLDDVFDDPRLDYLKLDIEGDEPLALQGAEKTIARCRPIMFIEVNRGALARNNCTPRQLIRQIEGYNYGVSNLHQGAPLSGEQFDVLCFPK